MAGASAQMFEIPAEMLQGMMGGGMMGGGSRGPPPLEWPKTENSEIASEFDWLVNTEWKGKTAKYLLLRDGTMESSLKECEPEGRCLWAANNGVVAMNTPTLKVIKFKVVGLDKADIKRLDNKDQEELAKVYLESVKTAKSGKKSQLKFVRVAVADATDSFITKDLYEVLEVEETAEQSDIKSKYRKLSITHHPDKGGDPKKFNEIREAYEVLSDKDMRRYYDIGGIQLVKNVEVAWKEVEGQKAQMDAQLNQVPKNHPQRRQFEAQIKQQKQQFEGTNMKHEIEKKLRNDDVEVAVPISALELYHGAKSKTYEFKRLIICRGCRDDPDSPKCKECGRCPPEKVQVPKYANTPFGKQVVAMKEKEQESRERCRELPIVIKDLKVTKGAKEGSMIRYVSDVGHQTPGKIPGKIKLIVQRGSPTDTYAIAEMDLHTVLHLSMEQALFGFSVQWMHLGDGKDDQLTVTHPGGAQPGKVIKIPKKGLLESGVRGDLYIRLAVDVPEVGSAKEITFKAQPAGMVEAKLTREDPVELREGAAWRRWEARGTPEQVKDPAKRDEL